MLTKLAKLLCMNEFYATFFITAMAIVSSGNGVIEDFVSSPRSLSFLIEKFKHLVCFRPNKKLTCLMVLLCLSLRF